MNFPVLTFIHIPKTAGTTFSNILYRNYKTSEVFTLYERAFLLKRLDKLSHNRNCPKLITGHVGVGIHDYLPNVKYITFLRSPVKRVFSMYNHIVRNRKHYLHDKVVQMSFNEYLKFSGDESIHNSQLRFISGLKFKNQLVGNDDFVDKLTDEQYYQLLQNAKKNIDDRFLAIGISERMNLSLFLMKKVGVLNYIGYTSLNSSPKYSKIPSGNIDSIHEEDFHLAAELNRYDIELYNYAYNSHIQNCEELNINEDEANEIIFQECLKFNKFKKYASEIKRKYILLTR